MSALPNPKAQRQPGDYCPYYGKGVNPFLPTKPTGSLSYHAKRWEWRQCQMLLDIYDSPEARYLSGECFRYINSDRHCSILRPVFVALEEAVIAFANQEVLDHE